LNRNKNVRGGNETVDGDYAQRGRRIDENIIVFINNLIEVVFKTEDAVQFTDQTCFKLGQGDFRWS